MEAPTEQAYQQRITELEALVVDLRSQLAQRDATIAALQQSRCVGIQMIDVHLPVNDGRCLVMARHTEPEPEQQLLLEKLGLHLPPQPPPKIYASQLAALAPYMEVPNP